MPSFCERKKHELHCNQHNIKFTCLECNESFDSATLLVNHEETSGHNNPGTSGSSSLHTPSNSATQNIDLHPQQQRQQQQKVIKQNNVDENKKVKCSICKTVFPNRSILFKHQIVHRDLETLQAEPWSDRPMWEDERGTIDNALKETYDHHRHLILRSNKKIKQTEVKSVYNFPLNEYFSLNNFIEHIERIYNDTNFAFKINLSLGLILRHIRTLEYRYFIPYYNQNIFNVPILISRREDLSSLRERLSEVDIRTYMLRQRKNTAWKPWCITNVNVEIYRTAFALGHVLSLPAYLKNSKSIIGFVSYPYSLLPYNDSLCFFRCLAYHKEQSEYVETLCKKLFSQWVEYVKTHGLKSNDATLRRIPDLEKCFNINIHVYSLTETESAVSKYKSQESILNSEIKKT